MITVSDKYKESLASGNRNFQVNSTLTLTDGTQLAITNACLWSGGFTIEDAVTDESSFQVGGAIINQCTIILNNIYDDYTKYDFYGATLDARVGLQFDDGTTEYMRKGMYVVADTEFNSSLITLTCYDYMYLFDKSFDINVEFPITTKELVNKMCSKCGITLATLDFPHSSYELQEPSEIEDTTYRTILMWICQICGCFARFNTYGELEIKWFNQSALENPSEHQNEIHSIQSSFEKELSTDDVVITGVQITEVLSDGESGDAKTYLSGTDDYVVSIENNDFLYDGLGEEVATWLGNQLIGLQFRSGQITHLSDPTIEAGDVAIFTDEKSNEYKLIVSGTTYTLNNSQVTRSSAETPVRNSSHRYSNETRNYVKARAEIKREKTEREKALESLSNRIDNAPGFYTTEETDTAGGKIYYIHNKPTLTESSMAWKMTAEAFSVSTNKDSAGDFIWSAGMTVNGDVITRILDAVGVSASWINTGALTIKDDDGNILFEADVDKKTVAISGASVSVSGVPVDEAIEKAKEEAQEFSDSKLSEYAGTVSSNLEKLQKQVDGQIETFYYDYEPTLNNIPASEWTTETKRKVHEGDLFYWKSKGFAYRFFYDDSVSDWKWVLVQDTDITKALETANKAQETADGKMRVFVEQPVPPYNVGDLWSKDGGDILTCVVTRVKDSIFLESDWEKKNNYADTDQLDEVKENTIYGVTVLYAQSDSKDTAPTSGWSEIAPDWVDGKYMWQKTHTVYGDGSATDSEPVCISGARGAVGLQGIQGEKGDQGIQGEKGEKGEKGEDGKDGTSGKTSYFHIKYSSVENPTSASQMTETPSTYIGTYVDFTEADSANPSKYTWSRFQGLQGEDGQQGIPGTNGENGKTTYLHIKYSNDGGKTFTPNSGETVGTYIGTCTDFTQTDPTDVSSYTWAKIKGETGDKGDTGAAGKDGKQLYATCSSAKATVAKVATITPTTSITLYVGMSISVTFTNENTATNPTLNVNSTGAKPIYAFGSSLQKVYYWKAKATVQFVYNGTAWVMSNDNAMSLAAQWAHDNDATYIDGSRIYASSIKAEQIDTENLFAQNIEATNMHLSGDSSIDGIITAKAMTLGDGDKCVIKWGEDAIKFDDGTVAEIGYRGGANQPHNAMYIGVENVSLVAGVSNDTGTAYTSYSGITADANGEVWIDGDNGIYLNKTNWDDHLSSFNDLKTKQGKYDWSTFDTENTSDTWVPVMNGSIVNHRVIPSDAFKAQSNGIFRKYGKVVVANFYGTSTSSLPWVPEGWAPTADVSIPVTVMYNSNPYMGYLQIHTGRWMECKYYDYGSGKGTPASGSKIYGVATWIIA